MSFFDQFYDRSMSNEDVAARLQKERRYTYRACQSRTSHARSIIKAGRAVDALEMVRLSTSPQVTTELAVPFACGVGLRD